MTPAGSVVEDLRDASPRPGPELCRVCHDPKRAAVKFNLNVTYTKPKHTTRGAGRLFLCERCWRELTAGSPRRGGSAPK